MSVFDDMYRGTPPWDIGRPQEAVRQLAELDQFQGRVLDVGCGTGDNALYLAGLGLEVVGVDIAERAIEKAREKARGAKVARAPRFIVGDALHLERLNAAFDTVLDCGFLHTLTDDGRELYLRSLAQVMPPGALLHVLCFSDREPDWGGPRRLTRKELEELGGGFFLDDVVPTRFENTISDEGSQAWRATYSFGGKGPTTLQ
jgi:ubiquinone/menaquinone biosynthesis C-methylase UbiE